MEGVNLIVFAGVLNEEPQFVGEKVSFVLSIYKDWASGTLKTYPKINAFGSVARNCQHLKRGDLIYARCHWQDERVTTDGVDEVYGIIVADEIKKLK